MPQRDAHHDIVKRALIKAGWNITAEQYVVDAATEEIQQWIKPTPTALP